jgi:hypothetical protein
MENLAAPTKMGAGQRVVLSLKAALAGWAIFVVMVFALCGFSALFDPHAWVNGQNPFVALYLFGIGSAVVVACVWFFIALPLALLVPDRSVFWSPQILPIVGISTGIVVVCLYQIYDLRSNSTIRIYDWNAYIAGDILLPCIPSAFIGGVVGGIAAYLHKNLRNR